MASSINNNNVIVDKTTLYTNTLHDKHQALMQIINRYDTNMNQLLEKESWRCDARLAEIKYDLDQHFLMPKNKNINFILV